MPRPTGLRLAHSLLFPSGQLPVPTPASLSLRERVCARALSHLAPSKPCLPLPAFACPVDRIIAHLCDCQFRLSASRCAALHERQTRQLTNSPLFLTITTLLPPPNFSSRPHILVWLRSKSHSRLACSLLQSSPCRGLKWLTLSVRSPTQHQLQLQFFFIPFTTPSTTHTCPHRTTVFNPSVTDPPPHTTVFHFSSCHFIRPSWLKFVANLSSLVMVPAERLACSCEFSPQSIRTMNTFTNHDYFAVYSPRVLSLRYASYPSSLPKRGPRLIPMPPDIFHKTNFLPT